MTNFILTGYIAAYALYALTLLTCLVRWDRLSRILSVAALAVNGGVLAGIFIVVGQPPVFEIYGGLLFTAFVLGILGLLWSPDDEKRLSVAAWVWIGVLLLFCVTLFFPKEPPPYQHHHSYLWVIFFHGFRCLALSFALFSAAHFIRFRTEPVRKRAGNSLFRQGRNFLLLSALAFLCGEYAGILWCQHGWGDFWHWNGAFFQSTLIILCFMFAFHIPGKNPRADDIRSITAILAPFMMLTVKIVKGLMA